MIVYCLEWKDAQNKGIAWGFVLSQLCSVPIAVTWEVGHRAFSVHLQMTPSQKGLQMCGRTASELQMAPTSWGTGTNKRVHFNKSLQKYSMQKYKMKENWLVGSSLGKDLRIIVNCTEW